MCRIVICHLFWYLFVTHLAPLFENRITHLTDSEMPPDWVPGPPRGATA